jgi:hypothetical protein
MDLSIQLLLFDNFRRPVLSRLDSSRQFHRAELGNKDERYDHTLFTEQTATPAVARQQGLFP